MILRHRQQLHTAEEFLAECCACNENNTVSTVKLCRSYEQWCGENGLKPEGRNTFYEKVRNHDASIKEGKVNYAGKRVCGFIGIGLIEQEVKP